MAINKNAYIRYMVIDECLTTWKEEDRISEKIRQKCADEVKLRDDSGYSAKNDIISPRLFQMDLKNIESIWGEKAKIRRMKFKFGPNAGKYFYSYVDPSFTIRNAPLSKEQENYLSDIIQSFSLFSGLPQFGWMKTAESNLQLSINSKPDKPIFSIEYNNNEKVNKLLPILAEHIKKKQVIVIRYIKYNSPESDPGKYVMSPLYLKQFNARWYLFGFCHFKDGPQLRNIPLDQIVNNYIQVKENIPFYDEDIDWKAYFSQIVGVTLFKDNEVEEIVLKIIDPTVSYLLLNNPIHENQVCEWCDSEHKNMLLTLRVRRNRELMNILRRYTGQIQIIKPEALKTDYLEFLKKGIELNETD